MQNGTGFEREEAILEKALRSLENDREAVSFAGLADEYARLLRQARRLVAMGDRMQRSLSDLNRELAVNEEKYRTTFERVAEGIYRARPDGRLVEVNPAMASIFGFASPEDMLETVRRVSELFLSPQMSGRYEQELKLGRSFRGMEAEMHVHGGGVCWCELGATALHAEGAGNASCGMVGVVADVTERRKAMEDMCRLARTDALTGLWNRGYFMELTRRELSRSARRDQPLALLMVDADHFKSINDTHGHDAGDRALCRLSDIFARSLREEDVAARYGGEEFVILLPDTTRERACCAARRLLDEVRAATVVSGACEFGLTVSIGVAAERGVTTDLDGLLKLADIALYAAKKNGRDRFEVYRRRDRCA